MRTYLINSIRQLSRTEKKLDLVSTMMANEWVVFSENHEEVEKLLFLDREELLISKNGKSYSAKWRYLAVNSSVTIEDSNDNYLFKLVLCDKNILVLNLDGTKQYCFLINPSSILDSNKSFSDIQWYLIRSCNIDLLTEQQREIYERENQLKKQKQQEIENERVQEIRKNNKAIIIFIVALFAIVIGGLLFGIII